MRVTYNALIESVRNGFYSNISRLQEVQEKLSSGKNISSPSDGPSDSAKLMIFKTKKSEYKQFVNNINESLSWLYATESSVNQINNSIMDLRSAAIEGGNGSLPEEARNSIALKVIQIKEKLLNDANAKYLNKYLFSGLQTLTKPFDEGPPVTYNGDTNTMIREISFGADIGINVNGSDLFNMGVSDEPNIFEVIDELALSLQNGDVNKISNTILGQLDDFHNIILNTYSEIGSRVQRLELTRDQHEHYLINMTTMISQVEDIDIAKVVMDLNKAEMVYNTSLSVAGRVFPVTLLDFLR